MKRHSLISIAVIFAMILSFDSSAGIFSKAKEKLKKVAKVAVKVAVPTLVIPVAAPIALPTARERIPVLPPVWKKLK